MGKKHNIREKNPNWKGGKYKNKDGYIMVHSPNHPKANHYQPYIGEHVLVMEESLKRHLTDSEVVHHKDLNRSNNDLNNLELFPSQKEHMEFHNKMEIPFTEWKRKQ